MTATEMAGEAKGRGVVYVCSEAVKCTIETLVRVPEVAQRYFGVDAQGFKREGKKNQN